jgi:paraquat-inducible protein B
MTTPIIEKRRGISPVWILPIVALLIGGWLAYRAVSEKGPVVTITFKTAEGIEAFKTKIKYKDVEIGQITAVDISEDLSHVVLKAELTKSSKKHLTDKTRFWVVRARLTAGGVSGLGTLFSGAYIGIDPVAEGSPVSHFKGLEVAPIITADVPGNHYLLQAETLGSLDIGTPVYFRKIQVGQVVAYDFNEKREGVDIKIFVNEPHHALVYKNTKFWNASGIDVSVDANGIKINTESLVSIMEGGIAFETPSPEESATPSLQQRPKSHSNELSTPAEKNTVFKLYEDYNSTKKKLYTEKSYFLMYFDETVKGLTPGAPVKFRGITIGEVVDINLEYDVDKRKLSIPVLMAMEEERIKVTGETQKGDPDLEFLIEHGLRAQLKTGNLLTGQQYIGLDFFPEAPAAKLLKEERFSVFPTIPAPFEQIAADVASILKKVDKIPFEQIGTDLQATLESLTQTLQDVDVLVKTFNNETMKDANRLLVTFNEETTPALNETVLQIKGAIAGLEQGYGTDSAFNYNLNNLLDELATTMQSLRALTDYLEHHPESVIFGKESKQ